MAWIFDGKHFGGYTYEHWFDEDSAPDTGENPDAEAKTAAKKEGKTTTNLWFDHTDNHGQKMKPG
jgi:hypothetical protein